MTEKIDFEKELFDAQWFEDIRKRPDVLAKIKLDVTPQMVMEPKFQSRPEDREKMTDISGYMFYVESQNEPPALMLMKVGRQGVATTMGQVEIPVDMLRRAIENPVEKHSHGMYAITDEIREWLKKELGL